MTKREWMWLGIESLALSLVVMLVTLMIAIAVAR